MRISKHLLPISFSDGVKKIFNADIIDRYLIAAEQTGIEPILVLNKADLLNNNQITELNTNYTNLIILSAKNKTGINDLLNSLTELANKGALSNNETIVSNSRHFEALNNAYTSIKEIQQSIHLNVSADLFAIDIRQALFYLGEITGEVTTEDLLGNIFANFCIGK